MLSYQNFTQVIFNRSCLPGESPFAEMANFNVTEVANMTWNDRFRDEFVKSDEGSRKKEDYNLIT